MWLLTDEQRELHDHNRSVVPRGDPPAIARADRARASQMLKQPVGRDPIWPEAMPGAPGVASGQSAPSPVEQPDSPQEKAGAAA
jgi:hypothetical protein